MYVHGFGRKGTGKDANYGVAIPPPVLLEADAVPPPAQQASSSSDQQCSAPIPTQPAYPPPIPVSPEKIDEWIAENFRPLGRVSSKMPPEIGEEVLWRGVKTGRHGQPSTSVEYFNGKVRYIDFDESDEMFLYID